MWRRRRKKKRGSHEVLFSAHLPLHLNKQQRGKSTGGRRIKAAVGQAVWLKQDVSLFLACVWNSVRSRAGPWFLSLANGVCVQADKAKGICSTFHRPFKKHSGPQRSQVLGEMTASVPSEQCCRDLVWDLRSSRWSPVSYSHRTTLSGPAGWKTISSHVTLVWKGALLFVCCS